MAYRKKLPLSDFAIPSKAPGPGSYPEQTLRQAIIAKRMARNGAKGAVDALARRKYGI